MIKTGLVWSSTSSVRPGTRANSLVLFVTSIAPKRISEEVTAGDPSALPAPAFHGNFRLLTHDERADTGIKHINLVHKLNR